MGNAVITNSKGLHNVGILTASGARFTDDGSDSPIVSIQTDDANPNGLNIGNQTYSANTAFGLNLYSNNAGEGYFRHVGNAAYKDYHFYLHDNSNAKLCLKFEADDQSAELYAGGSLKPRDHNFRSCRNWNSNRNFICQVWWYIISIFDGRWICHY